MAIHIRHCTLSAAVLILTWLPGGSAIAAPVACPPAKGVTLQVLGSGGPIADDDRAGSGYVVWIDGRARVLIDAGSGTFLRFAESGASFTDLDFVGLSHFHVDHTAGLPALLKSGSFSGRSRALIIAGPAAAEPFPGLRAFMASLLDKEEGAYAYLGGYLDGQGRLPKLALFEVHELNTDPVLLLGDADGDYQVSALRISHGIVPALAYRVRVGDSVVVFAGDQDGKNENLARFAENADILVLHMPISESATGVASQLHAHPSVLGQLAENASAKVVIVSHLMRRSLTNIDANIAQLQSRYNGAVQVAHDLSCHTVHQE